MRSFALIPVTILLAATLPARAGSQSPAPIVFFDIAGPKLRELTSFYADLFGWNLGESGKSTVPVASPLPITLRQDPVEKRIYIGVADVAKKLEEIQAHHGTIDMPKFAVPGIAVIGLFRDPAGNPMGLVEMRDGKVEIP